MTRIDEGRKCQIISGMKNRARAVMGRVERNPLYDHGSKIYYWESESNASITTNGMGKEKEVKCINAAVINTIPKLVAPMDLIWTASCVVLSNWSMYNFSNHTQRTWSVTLLAPDA